MIILLSTNCSSKCFWFHSIFVKYLGLTSFLIDLVSIWMISSAQVNSFQRLSCYYDDNRLYLAYEDSHFIMSSLVQEPSTNRVLNLVPRPQTVFSQSQPSTDLGPGTDSRFVAIFATIMDF